MLVCCAVQSTDGIKRPGTLQRGVPDAPVDLQAKGGGAGKGTGGCDVLPGGGGGVDVVVRLLP